MSLSELLRQGLGSELSVGQTQCSLQRLPKSQDMGAPGKRGAVVLISGAAVPFMYAFDHGLPTERGVHSDPCACIPLEILVVQGWGTSSPPAVGGPRN